MTLTQLCECLSKLLLSSIKETVKSTGHLHHISRMQDEFNTRQLGFKATQHFPDHIWDDMITSPWPNDSLDHVVRDSPLLTDINKVDIYFVDSVGIIKQ